MRPRIYLQVVILFLLPLIVFSRSLDFGFLWIDHFQIEADGCIIKNFQGLKDAFLRPILISRGRGNYYRPLFKLSYTLDYLLYDKNPAGFHFTNLLLHIFNLIFLYFILLRLSLSDEISFFLALLYGVLPLNTSAVVWVGARADLLATFFILLSLLLYFLYQRRNRIVYFISSLFLYSLALLSKESAFPFFILVVIIGYFIGKKSKAFIPYFLLAIIYLLLRVNIIGHFGTRIEILRGAPRSVIFSSMVGFLKYILKFFCPVNLSVTDAFPKFHSLFHPFVFLGVISITGFFISLLYSLFKKNFILALATSWIMFFYLPISNIVPGLHFWAERFFYLPGIGMVILLGYLFSRRRFLKFIFIFLLPFYTLVTIQYQKYFENDFLLFQRALKVSKFSKEAHAILGYFYLINKDYLNSIYHYHLSIQPEENYFVYSPLPEVYNNLGVIFMRLGQYREAERWLRKALEIDKNYEAPVLNLEIIYSKSKDENH